MVGCGGKRIRDEKRRRRLLQPVVKISEISLNGEDASRSRSQNHPYPVLIHRILVEASGRPGLSECYKSELVTSGEAPNLLLCKMVLRIKTRNLCRNLYPIRRRIEDRNLLGPVLPFDKRIPELRDIVPDSTDDSKASNDNSLLHLIPVNVIFLES
jgi:hypothetical protein